MIVLRLGLTAVAVLLAVFGAHYLWTNHFEQPWTRDARIRADVVAIASDVPGKVVAIHTANNAEVQRGDVLFEIDPRTFRTDLDQASAQVTQARANLRNATQQSERADRLSKLDAGAVSAESVASSDAQTAAARAAVRIAEAGVEASRLQLERTRVTSPVTGYVTNMNVDVGDYAQPGTGLLAVVDSSSYRVDAFFMETKLPRIRVGDDARIKLMSSGEVLQGRVAGIARAIGDLQNGSSAILQSPLPSFEWIRLAQRIPVEVQFKDPLPPSVLLVGGATASVTVTPGALRASDAGPAAGDL